MPIAKYVIDKIDDFLDENPHMDVAGVHIALSDLNLDNYWITSAIEDLKDQNESYQCTEEDFQKTIAFLKYLLSLPLEDRED